MYDTITNIRVCSQINIDFVELFRITDLMFNVFHHFIILFVNLKYILNVCDGQSQSLTE